MMEQLKPYHASRIFLGESLTVTTDIPNTIALDILRGRDLRIMPLHAGLVLQQDHSVYTCKDD